MSTDAIRVEFVEAARMLIEVHDRCGDEDVSGAECAHAALRLTAAADAYREFLGLSIFQVRALRRRAAEEIGLTTPPASESLS